MDLFGPPIRPHKLVEEPQELAARVKHSAAPPLGPAPKAAKSESVPCRMYRSSAARLGPGPSARRAARGPVDGGLLIDTEDGGVLGRVEVEPDDVGGFLLEVRVRTRQIGRHQVRLEALAPPEGAPFRHSRRLWRPSRASPMRQRLRRRLIDGQIENPCLGGRRDPMVLPARARGIEERQQAALDIAPFPQRVNRRARQAPRPLPSN